MGSTGFVCDLSTLEIVMHQLGKIKKWLIFFFILTYAGYISNPTQQPKTSIEILETITHSNQQDFFAEIKNIPKFNQLQHSDGCSGGMSAIYEKLVFLHQQFGDTLPWRECCVIHDKAYFKSGSKQQKINADKALRVCVSEKLKQNNLGMIIGYLMQETVRVGGLPYFPTSYRWGYGIDFRAAESLPAQ